MAQKQGRTIQAQIQTLFNEGVTAGLTDGQLLERFTTRRGPAAEQAFASLVERHGPMVLGACRKILRDDHQAEDAVQATFLVLAHKGGSLWVQDSLGPWLHRVACRIAVRAKIAKNRSDDAERSLAECPRSRSDNESPDLLGQALHEEIDRLPAIYRMPVVLCGLEGRTYEEAARHLGCPVGTVKSRLARGRLRLRNHLARRGLDTPAGLLAVMPTPNSTKTAVPIMLADSLTRAAMRIASGTTTVGAVPTSAATLTEGMMKMMSRSKLACCVGAVIGIGILTVGIGVLVCRTAGAPPEVARGAGTARAAAPIVKNDDPAPKEPGQTGEIIARVANIAPDALGDGHTISMVAIDPETAKWRTIAKDLPPGPVSPDGRFIVYQQLGLDLDEGNRGIWVYDTTGETPPRRIFERNGIPSWSHDGQQVVIGTPPDGPKLETWRINADGSGRSKLPIPETDLVFDCSRDGTWLATRTIGSDPVHWGRLTLVHPDGTGAQHLTEGSAKKDVFNIFRISPDGQRIAYVEVKTENDIRKCRLFVIDLKDRSRREIPVAFEPDTTTNVCWSPDGSRLALNPMNNHTKEGAIVLVDLDGKNVRTVPLPPGQWNLLVCDWKAMAPGLRVGDLNELSRAGANTPRGRFQALSEEVKKASPFEPRRFVGRFLELAESAPEDRAAVDAWIWIVTFGSDGPEYHRAIDRLADHHAGMAKVANAALTLSFSTSLSAEKLLRAVIEKNPVRYKQGLACLTLGQYFKHQAARIREIRGSAEAARQWEANFLEQGFSKEDFARFVGRDPAVLIKEAEAVLDRTVREFGDLPHKRGETLGIQAQTELDGIRNLQVDKPAPEIAGLDIDGKPFKLSDSQGKVVVLAFWGDWCASCRSMYKDEQMLAERMRGRPFVLLGVNSDNDRDKLKERITKEGLTWRSWWDGDESVNRAGLIARRYNVDSWPTFYVIDHRGLIRHIFRNTPSVKTLNSVIDAAVEAVEREPDTRKNDGPG